MRPVRPAQYRRGRHGQRTHSPAALAVPAVLSDDCKNLLGHSQHGAALLTGDSRLAMFADGGDEIVLLVQ